MRLDCTVLILFIAITSKECAGFQTPDPGLFQDAVEKSVQHKVDIAEPPRSVPMVSVFDDTTLNPNIHPDLSSLMQELFNSRKESTPSNNGFEDIIRLVQQLMNTNVKEVSNNVPTLTDSLNIKQPVIPSELKPRKALSADDNPTEYWYHNRIHTLGNVGFLGGIHAIMAPLVTFLIDKSAYKKLDVRKSLSKELRTLIQRKKARVLDLCCGVGMSTRALSSAFRKDGDEVIGVDTSPQMLHMARAMKRHESAIRTAYDKTKLGPLQNCNFDRFVKKEDSRTSYALGNAERTIFPDKSFDLVTIMYGFHEIPYLGRYRILREARRLLEDGGLLALIDISPEYQPVASMLAGEPYVLEYQQSIMKQMKSMRGFADYQYRSIIPGHVGMWLLTRKRSRASRNGSTVL